MTEIDYLKRIDELELLIQEFITHISMEFRTPLNFIAGSTELLLDSRQAGLSDVEQRKYLNTILKSAESLIAELDQLTHSSLYRVAGIPFQHTVISCETLIEHALTLWQAMQPHLSRDSVRKDITISLPSDLPQVSVDSLHVQRSLAEIFQALHPPFQVTAAVSGDYVLLHFQKQDQRYLHLPLSRRMVAEHETGLETSDEVNIKLSLPIAGE